jgi:hypothetical protein
VLWAVVITYLIMSFVPSLSLMTVIGKRRKG